MMKELLFTGRGPGLGVTNTGAYFVTDKDLVIIDCSQLGFVKLSEMDLSIYERIFILQTHTHGDHDSGIGLLVQHCWWKLNNKKLQIVAPSKKVELITRFVLEEKEGNEPEWFNICTVAELDEKFFLQAVLTEHSPQLAGKCFGYELNVNGQHVVYTGDTITLDPFIPLLKEGSILYVDVGGTFSKDIHLELKPTLPQLIELAKWNIKVYLMHMNPKQEADAKELIKKMPNISLVPLG